jgi:hypothetical protein
MVRESRAPELELGPVHHAGHPDALVLRVEATDETNLQRLQRLVAGHLERFGRRDNLKVCWRQPEASTVESGESATSSAVANPATRPRHRTRIALAAAVALLIAVHLGLCGAVLAGSLWASWVAHIVLAAWSS